MILTNKYNLPNAFVRAVENDPYSMGESDFSATGLDTPARARALIDKYKDLLEVDVSTRVATTIGQGTHSIVERAARKDIDICEKRYFASFIVDGISYLVSAQIDLYESDTGVLYDWKTTKAYAFHKKTGNGKKPEWISQMNVGAELMRRNAIIPTSLQIIALLKDWSRKEALTPGYPATEVMAVELPMWSSNEVTAYIEGRIRAHIQAKASLPLCTKKENWNGNRCAGYCDASSVCSQWKEAKETGLIGGS